MEQHLTAVEPLCAHARIRRPRKPRASDLQTVSKLPRAASASSKSWAAALLAVIAISLCVSSARAAKPDMGPSTSRSARDDAVRAIPLDKLSAEAREKVGSVLGQVSIFRRLPTQVIECDPNLYLFLVEHPDLVVNMWEVMDVSDMRLEKTGPDTFRANDGVGTAGNVEYLHRSYDTHIMYAEGSYSGPIFLNPVHGKCLLVLKTGYAREPDDRYFITCRLDTFIQLKNVGIELVAKTFQPLVGKTADHNFRETAAFMGLVSRSAEHQPLTLQQLAAQLTRVGEQDREQFCDIANQLTLAALERKAPAKPPVATAASQRKTAMKPASGAR